MIAIKVDSRLMCDSTDREPIMGACSALPARLVWVVGGSLAPVTHTSRRSHHVSESPTRRLLSSQGWAARISPLP